MSSHVASPFQSPAVLSLCPGFLGLERGLQRAIGKINVVAYVEIEAFIVANLIAGMEAGMVDAALVWTDVKTFNAKPFRKKIQGIIGGYPCQPFSLAGQRKGTDDPRHLWPHICRIIKAAKPVWCFFENVSAHLSMGYDLVYKDLRALGYAVEAGIYTAEEAGAPHERERLFILAISRNFLGYTRRKRIRWEAWANIGGGSQGAKLEYTPGNDQCNDRHQSGKPEFPLGGPGNGEAGSMGYVDHFPGRLSECEPGQRRCQQINSIEIIRASETVENTGSQSAGNKSRKIRRRNRQQNVRQRFGKVGAIQSGTTGTETELEHTNGRRCEQCNEIIRRFQFINVRGNELADTSDTGLPRSKFGQTFSGIGATAFGPISQYGQSCWPALPGQEQYPWEEPRTIEPRLGSTINGYNFREDLLRGLGNMVVEQTAEIAIIDLLSKFQI